MDEGPTRKVRLVVVLAEGKIPVWLRNLLMSLAEVDYIDVRAVVAITVTGYTANTSSLFRLWKRLDGRIFQRNWLADLRTELFSDLDVAHSRATIGEVDLPDSDVVAWMCPNRPPAELLSKAKFGFWTIADACRPEYGLREFIGRHPATECGVIRFGESPGEDRVLATGAAATDKLSFCRGLSELRAVANTLFISTLSRLHHVDGALVGDRAANNTEVPSLFEFVAGLGLLYGRYCLAYPSRFFAFDQWQMAYRIGGERLDQDGLTRLAPDHGGFWADPFMIEHNGHKALFFEEFSSELGRGHIAAMELRPDGSFDVPVNVLMCPYHLSYPFVFELDGSVFMIPESADAEKVEVFRCTQFPDTWEPHAMLLDGVRAYDTTLVEHDGMWWMFLTIQHGGNSPNDELHLYYANSPFEDWTPHRMNPIGLDVRNSRPAGKLFRDNGRLYRPAQDCSGRYGRAIVIREVRCMTTTEYEEVTASGISAAWAGDAHATHTVNQSAGVTVYDCEVRARKMARRKTQ